MRNIFRPIIYLATLAVCLIVLITCIKVEKVVMVSTGSVKNVQTNTATAEGTIVDAGEGISDHGFVYSTTKDVTMSGTKVALGSKGSIGSFTSELSNLTAGTKYYIKAYVMGSSGTQLGKEETFETADPVVPTLTTTAVSAITTSTAVSGGNITLDGGAPVTARGVCWSTSSGPTVTNTKSSDNTGTGSFTSNISGLAEGTTYYVRAYATNAAGTGYGTEISFSTVAVVLPTVTTTAPTNISSTFAQGGGNVTSDGGSPILAKGVCWSKNSNPTTSDSKTDDGTGSGAFGNGIVLLEPATLYHVRAYATNSKGTAYGDDLTFTTLPGLPTVKTAAIIDITSISATSGGEVTSDGGSQVTARGVCWSLYSNPTTTDNNTINSSGTGVFTSSLTGLSPSTTYHVRAYATNSAGTAYGDDVTFTTGNPVYAPSVLTATPISITTTTAVSGGNVSESIGSPVASKGVCWSTSTNPTINDQKTNDGSGLGVFTSNITGLSPATKYYLKAYATNDAGMTGYGSEATFTTNSVVLPTVTTYSVSAISSQKAFYSGGEVTNEGSAVVTSRGVCWSTTSSPKITDSKADASTGGPGIFTCYITGLTPSTAYNVRAFATSSEGTSYGNEVSFTTTIQVTDIEGNKYNTVKIGSQLWMQENLKVTKFRDGTSIKYLTDNTSWSTQTSGAYCWYDNDMATNKDTYGALYNYYTTIQNLYLCPTGWRVPTDADWSVLETFLGGNTVAGGKLKETGTGHWISPNAGATNETGFTALPGGLRMDDGTYTSKTTNGYWWYSTESTAFTANRKDIAYNAGGFYVMTVNKNFGVSVRCLQGEGKVLPIVTTTAITNPSSTGATSGGNVTSDGGTAITAKGVCWSTSHNPDISLTTTTSDGPGAGSYTSTITGLTIGTTYYVRAYATNSLGTSYGDEITYTNCGEPPSAFTSPAINIGSASAQLSGGGSSGVSPTSFTFEIGKTISYGGIVNTTPGAPAIATGLEPNTVYHFRFKVESCAGTAYGSDMTFTTLATVMDRDSWVYNTITIGSQVWMQENLKTTSFQNGDIIGTTSPATKDISGEIGPKYQWPNGGNESNVSTYGRLYTWYAITDSRNVCPTGWHIPTDAEWTILENYLMANYYNYDLTLSGNKYAKSLGSTELWVTSTNIGSVGNTDYPGKRNSTRFTGLPGGYRINAGIFHAVGTGGCWATSTESSVSENWTRLIVNIDIGVSRMYYEKDYGYSVRCIKD